MQADGRREKTELINITKNKLALEKDNDLISYLGGVFNLGEVLFDRLEMYLADHIHIVEPAYSPEKEAVF